jgi:branched-chain amino acid transport system permease protein
LAPDSYFWVMAIDVLIATLFALGLSWLMGSAGMDSFGHAAYFGMGAYATALLSLTGMTSGWMALVWGPLAAGVLALLFGALCVRLSGVYLAMLSLALAQVVWGIAFEGDGLTGGSNGLNGIPAPLWLQSRPHFYLLALVLAAAATAGLWWLDRAPFGLSLRASRDAPVRAESLGISVPALRWLAWGLAGGLAGLAGSLFAWAKGGVSPEVLSLHQSLQGLVMVLLGGLGSQAGPWLGALAFNELQDELARFTEYWRAGLGLVLLGLVLALPQGLAGCLALWRHLTPSKGTP